MSERVNMLPETALRMSEVSQDLSGLIVWEGGLLRRLLHIYIRSAERL